MYIVKLLIIDHEVFLKINENSISIIIIIWNFYMGYKSSDGVPAPYNESVALSSSPPNVFPYVLSYFLSNYRQLVIGMQCPA